MGEIALRGGTEEAEFTVIASADRAASVRFDVLAPPPADLLQSYNRDMKSVLLVVTVLLCACAGSQPANAPTTSSAASTSPTPAPPRASSEGRSPIRLHHGQLAEEEERACALISQALADRSVPLSRRRARLQEHVEREPALARALDRLSDDDTCPALHRFAELVRNDDPDVAPEYRASAQADLARLCEIVEQSRAEVDPADRARQIAERFTDEVTNLELRRGFEAVAHAEPTQRYDLLLRAAAEMGVPEWRCAALEALQRGR